uniref:Drebrin-like protein n=1 Tax=Ditylenchus dipsaci TaxID=166011 RepID=A0A915DII8_9BILA
MTCNLLNHEKDLKNAFNTVSNSATGEQWCIFEYDGNSNIVKLGSTGESGGLEGLIEELNSGKIQYGFATTTAGNSAQRKIILIHWQGEGVPAARLANTAAHAEEIRRFVRLVHLTIYARNEEDVDSTVIAKQLASKLPMEFMGGSQQQAVSSNSTATNSQSSSTPGSNRSSMSTPWFWNEMRAEEESRRREEVQRKEEQQKTFAIERRQLESQLHQTHLNAAASNTNPKNLVKAQSVDSSSKKGKLIAGRTQLFEQKVAEIAKSMPKPLTKPKNFKFQVGVAKPGGLDQIPVNRQQQQQQPQSEGLPTVVECSFERRPIGKLNGVTQPPQIPVLPVHPVARKEAEVIEEAMELDLDKKNNQQQQQLDDAPPGDDQIREVVPGAGQTVRAKALWDYQAEDDTEISFDPEDVITEVEMIHDGWWRGKSPRNGLIGLFPSNYVELL